jgi:hypothetical protein
MIKAPTHYKDTKLMDILIEHEVPFAEGNIIKYVFRWRKKDGLRDLHKARDYLSALIAHEEFIAAQNKSMEVSIGITS